MEILTSEQMSKADRYTIDELKIPSIVLMENAAKSAFDIIHTLIDKNDNIAIVVGSGNNGGDGLAIGRYLFLAGFRVELFLMDEPSRFSKDALINYNILINFPIKISGIDNFEPVNFDVIIDAIFGTGLNRPLNEKTASVVDRINFYGKKVIAIDIPSGLSGSSNKIIGKAVKADYTITFCRPKIPHVLFPAKKLCGKIFIADISIPDFVISKIAPDIFDITMENLPVLRRREKDSHKGDFGHAAILGGSEGKSGAVIMSSLSCLRAGAGLVTAVIPKAVSSAFSSFVPEAMSLPVGNMPYLDIESIDEIAAFLRDKTVAAMGPGLGRVDKTGLLVKELLKKLDIPFVLDADAINNITLDDLENIRYKAVLTPHIGEFARLLNIDKQTLLDNVLEIARDFSLKYSVFLVLKSADTIIALPDGNIHIFQGGVPALAKGGSGDCLTGIITALISQKYSLKDAAILGVYILGKTAEKLTCTIHEMSLITRDVINNIESTLRDIADKQHN